MSGARDPRGRLLAVAMLLLVMPGMVLTEARGRAAVIDGDTLDVSGTGVTTRKCQKCPAGNKCPEILGLPAIAAASGLLLNATAIRTG